MNYTQQTMYGVIIVVIIIVIGLLIFILRNKKTSAEKKYVSRWISDNDPRLQQIFPHTGSVTMLFCDSEGNTPCIHIFYENVNKEYVHAEMCPQRTTREALALFSKKVLMNKNPGFVFVRIEMQDIAHGVEQTIRVFKKSNPTTKVFLMYSKKYTEKKEKIFNQLITDGIVEQEAFNDCLFPQPKHDRLLVKKILSQME